MKRGGDYVTRALFERSMDKLRDPGFGPDVELSLAPECLWDLEKSARIVSAQLISLRPGDPWKGEG